MYIWATGSGVDEVVERLRNTSLEEEHRDEVARDSIVMWRDHFGRAPAPTPFGYVDGGYMSEDSLYFRHAENDYLEPGLGFPGFIGFPARHDGAGQSQAGPARQRRRKSRVLQGLGFASTARRYQHP